ncbi:fasciclin domain-containing protein [Flagellimonas sp. S174]|uniref:fasciclin domain-containing protein n=1 Tax=Flagellimonas sp. S174 TaxID=3410790 RepID=UPI003BF4A87B
MKALIRLSQITLVIFSFVLASCSDDDDGGSNTDQPTLNIVETAQATSDLSSLVSALLQADESADNDLVSALSGEGPFTVFAPTDAAFSDLLAQLDGFDSLDDFNNQELQNLLAVILEYHVIAGTAAFSTDLSDGQTLTTLQGSSLTVSTDGGVFIQDATDVSATVTATRDVETTNGVVHVIDKVLLPQTILDELADIILIPITDLAIANTNLQSLVAALQAANGDLPTVLRGDGPFTVLAPTDEAFELFLDGAELSDLDADVLTNVLLNHVISGQELSSTDLEGLGSGYSNTLATGPGDENLSIYFDTTDGVVFNGIAEVETPNVKALNGIIHVVDEVIVLPTVVTFAVADPNFSTLVSALTDLTPGTNFVSILSAQNGDGDDPFTVFAPTDDAFDKLMAIPGEADLVPILQHHVVAGANVRSGDLTPNGDTMATTLEGDMITITLPGTDDNIADVTDGSGNTGIGIDAVDVQAINGVIHVLDTVLIPDTNN